MTMTDPIADMLTRLRNANQAYHDAVSMPYSKLKAGVAEILKQEGYITSFEVAEPHEGEVGKTLTITPGCRDHLDEPGPADRPSGQPEGRGWGSPRLRLVTRDQEE